MHVLLAAFARVAAETPEATLILAGPADNPAYTASLHAQARALSLERRVRFVGERPRSELRRLMDDARVLVLPSASEGLARVLLEAMLRGTPVVATRVDGTPDVVRDGDTGYLVEPGDADGLASALRRVLRDPDVDRMGERARARVAASVSTAAYVDGHRRLFQPLIAAGRRARAGT